MSESDAPLISICIPHWQVKELVRLNLRSIRKYTTDVPYEVIVIDNNSKDESLDYLRSLKWIRLIERGSETPDQPVLAHATALDRGLREARGKYFFTTHIDVIFKKPAWPQPLLAAIESSPMCAASGCTKLETLSPADKFFRAIDPKSIWRKFFPREKDAKNRPVCPRDFCALYRTDVLRKLNLNFTEGKFTPGERIYLGFTPHGYTATMVPTKIMGTYLDHIAHGTAALRPEHRRLGHRMEQFRSQGRMKKLMNRKHVRELLADDSLDR